jgi:alkaline phosphatase D
LEIAMKIVFTSCMDAVLMPDQPVWKAIQDQDPDVLMLLGDQIYMDWRSGIPSPPDWKKKTDDAAGLLEFAKEMHSRYARQWAVDSFRSLIKGFVEKHDPARLFICWDDHDFAWNNSCGAGSHRKYSVPRNVRQVSRSLFEQFVTRLKANLVDDSYPAFDPMVVSGPAGPDIGVERIDEEIGGISFAMLDLRYYRLHRKEFPNPLPNDNPLMMGAGQMKRLKDMFARRPIFTVVTGGVPINHKYFNDPDGWSGRLNNEADYPDLHMFLDAAKSPVLYLAGDIHKNEWDGLIEKGDGVPSSYVVGVASSGAAIDKIAGLRVAPAFGLVDIVLGQRVDARNGSITVTFCSLNDQSVPKYSVPKKLDFDATGWLDIAGIPKHGTTL